MPLFPRAMASDSIAHRLETLQNFADDEAQYVSNAQNSPENDLIRDVHGTDLRMTLWHCIHL